MAILIIILYLVVGFAATFGYKYLSVLWDIYFDDDIGTVVAVLSGLFWPIVTPFAFAIIYAQHCAERAGK